VTKPIFVALKGNRLLNEFFLYVLEDQYTCGAAWCVAQAGHRAHAIQDFKTSASSSFVQRLLKRVYSHSNHLFAKWCDLPADVTCGVSTGTPTSTALA
jgi:hypothetical protein